MTVSAFVRMLGELKPSASTYRIEYRVIRGDGTAVVLEESARGFFDFNGKLRRLVGVTTDITERKRVEESLRESESRFRSVLEGSRDVIYRFNVQSGRFEYISPSVQEIMGYSAEELMAMDSQTGRAMVHQEDQAELLAAVARLEQEGKAEAEYRQRTKSGEYRWLSNRMSLVRDAKGKPLYRNGSQRDITDRKRAEQKLFETNQRLQALAAEESLVQAKAAAEAANVAKSQFLANMSHELRTPMNAILGMIDVAMPKALDPTVQDCLQTARGSADLLLTLLNDLLDSAKIESGKLELESAPFSLRRMLDQITRVLAVRASEKGLSFYCRMPDETPDAVVGDRMRLQQVLLNLAGNAIKFTERGDVEIGLHALLQDGEACLEFTVRDTGIGISPAGLERLFQPFAQADASMSRRFGGTGLGLSICKSLVGLMGGTIRVESEVGKGSTFYFTVHFPLSQELPADFEAPVALPMRACGQLRVLLVEDNPANQKLATYILKDRGHVVEIAGDGEEAVCLTERNRYDVILMDVQMPGMNGLEATAAIRQREGSESRVPIIAMTAHALKDDRDRCLAAGVDGYLSKPVNAKEMIGLVESLACGGVPVAEVAARRQLGGIIVAGNRRLRWRRGTFEVRR